MNIRGIAQRSLNVPDRVADLHFGHDSRRFANDLENDGNGSLLGIGVHDGQGNPFPLLIRDEDHKLTRFAFPGDGRGFQDHFEDVFR